MFVPPRPHVHIEDKGYELRIDIPPRRDAASLGQWAFLTFWLCGWTVGEVMVGSMVIRALLSLFGARPTVIGEPQSSHGPGAVLRPHRGSPTDGRAVKPLGLAVHHATMTRELARRQQHLCRQSIRS